MADVEVEVAVAVEVGEGRRGRPVAVAAQARVGSVTSSKRAVAPVAVEGVGPPAGDEQVGVAVVVVVADGDAVAVAPGQPAMPDALGDVLERAVAPVAEQAVAARRASCGLGGNGPPWTTVDVEPAVAVVVEQADARRSSWPEAGGVRSRARSPARTQAPSNSRRLRISGVRPGRSRGRQRRLASRFAPA